MVSCKFRNDRPIALCSVKIVLENILIILRNTLALVRFLKIVPGLKVIIIFWSSQPVYYKKCLIGKCLCL